MKIRSIRFDDFVWRELKRVCEKTNQTKSKFIRQAVLEKILRIERGEQ